MMAPAARALFLALWLIGSHGLATARTERQFSCGGQVESKIWASWDAGMRTYLERGLLQERLLQRGDVYALYDFQAFTHNLVAMARRCNRSDRLAELGALVQLAYGALEPAQGSSGGRRWVCRGGSVCNGRNGLRNAEVALVSVQFLGVAASVAGALTQAATPLDQKALSFIRETTTILMEHLLRWGDDAAVEKLRKAAAATPGDIKDGSSELFFTDRLLWMIALHAELAGLLRRQGLDLAPDSKARLARHCAALLRMFSARISLRQAKGRLAGAMLADLDRGYWRLYGDNRYAGYEKDQKPVACVPGKWGRAPSVPEVRVPARNVGSRSDIGWDISHARRLVHALDAIERNRDALVEVVGIDEAQLPAPGLASAFANTLVAVVWNGDSAWPLFSNYLSGANGWYRVAYDNGTGDCREGYPPYGLTGAFLTGGYITWARHQPAIGLLGRRLYELVDSAEGERSPFVVRYYRNLSSVATGQEKALARLMFLPALVAVGGT